MSQDLQPAGPLRRNEALAFIIERIARSGTSPSFGEIGRHLGVGPTRAKELVGQLIADGVIEKTPGGHRSLRVRDVAQSRSLLEDTLRRLGWTTAVPMGALQRPCPQGQLPVFPAFDHLPDVD